jgi:branched-subunit amino acid aminotransferase/4-amino-4-deoxychorismate lyase
MAETIWPAIVDGHARADGRVDVLVLGSGFQHGEGIFETLPVVGGHPHFLERHITRLAASADFLGLLPVPEGALFAADLEMLAAAIGAPDLAVRLFLFRDGGVIRRLAAATPLAEGDPPPAHVGLAPAFIQGPRPLAAHKTLNYLACRLGLQLGARSGLDEVLFCDHDGTVLEGTKSTVFMVRDGILMTPPLSRPILPGVTREVLLECARETGLPVLEEAFTLDDLRNADEGLLSASLKGVRAISTVDGRPLRAAPGPVTARLRALYLARVPLG